MSEVQETTVMKVARALYELENDQPYVLSWADASKSESMLEYYVEQAECAILASGLPAAIEARDKALERVKRLQSALKELHAIVWGECRSLLDEDSGGDSTLALEIEELLSRSHP